MSMIIQPTWGTFTAQAAGKTAHGFTVGQQVYHDGAGWQLAQANAQSTLRMGMVVEVIDAVRFLVGFEGVAEWPAHGLTVGTTYYLSADTAGALTPDQPVTAGSIVQPVLRPVGPNHVRMLEYVITAGGSNRNTVSALIPNNTVPAPGAAGFRLRLVRLASTESTGTVHISWKRGNGTSWSGVVAFTSIVQTNGGSGFSMKMLTGRFGWGTAQLVQDGGFGYLELVSNGSWSYSGSNSWDILYTNANSLGNRGVILEPPVQATTGTVVASISDSYLANTLGNLDDVDLTGVS